MSIAIVLVRRRAFEKRFSDIVEEQRRQRKRKGSLSLRRLSAGSVPRNVSSNSLSRFRSRSSRTEPKEHSGAMQLDHNDHDPEMTLAGFTPVEAEAPLQKQHSTNGDIQGRDQSEQSQQHENNSEPNRIVFAADVRDRSPTAYRRALRPPYTNVANQAESMQEDHDPEDPGHHTHFLNRFGRNSTFHHLSEAERLRLGGVEYRAVCLLSVVVPLYLFLWQFIGALAVGAYVAHNHASLAQENGLNPWCGSSFYISNVLRLTHLLT